MNIGFALNPTPPMAGIDPVQPDAADASVFAALFGQQFAARPLAAAPPQAQPPLTIAAQAEFTTPAEPISTPPQAPATNEQPQSPQKAVEAPAVSVAIAAPFLVPLPAIAPIEPIADDATPEATVNDETVEAAAMTTKPAASAPPPSPIIVAPAPEPAEIVAVGASDAPLAKETVIEITASSRAPDAPSPVESKPAAIAAPAAPQVHQTSAAPTEPAPAQVEVVLPTRPERLAADVGIEVVRQIGANRSEFSIRLDPPDLGRIDVRLEFNRGEVRAVVTSDNPATHDLLRRDAEGLARMLVDNGFKADSGAFRFDLRQDGGQGRAFAQQQSTSTFAAAEAALEPFVETARSTRRGLLDLVA